MQDIGCQLARNAHFLDVFTGFDINCHDFSFTNDNLSVPVVRHFNNKFGRNSGFFIVVNG